MAIVKIEGALPKEIREIKNNPPESIELNWDPEPYDLIYNSPIRMIYTIPEEEEPISSCASELESIFNPDSNSDNNNDKNNGSSSAQNDNKNNNDSDSDSNPKTFITLPDLTKEQKPKWFSNNNKKIMPECVHNTDTGSSLAKKEINIKEEIIDTGYVGNIIAMLQNNSEKTYIIEQNEKIAQTIFLLLEFRFMSKIDILVNTAEKEIVDKEEIISICQTISISPYDQYMLVIKREVKNQAQLFKAEATICELGEIGLTNFYILAKNIKIPIYNTTGKVIKIPKETIIGNLTTEVENQQPNHIPDFLQLCEYVDIISQTIYG
ncbi:hypothetical protein G9A89_010174 [Geosiphon pyriformis]|nr:hypothetical protein G9A89_010174 [Geosiphon pyriformis]